MLRIVPFAGWLIIWLLFGSIALAEPKAAKPQPTIYSSLHMQDVTEALDLLGLEHQTQEIDGQEVVADVRLVVRDRIVWFMYGYNCHDQTQNCSELQMRALIEQNEAAGNQLENLNQWNRQNRFVRAYTSSSGKTVVLEMDIYLAGGIALGNLTDQILLWRQSLREFSVFLKQQ